MYDSFFHPFFSPMRTVYVISDSQLEEIKRKQHEEALNDIETSRKRLEKTYQARIKELDEREVDLKKELKSLTASK
tara:strand:+ start:430 stop:657 length:228 start_codon:yes stop_codon:yes gene_type:complete